MNFVERVLMPLLNYETRVDRILHVWDSDELKYVTDLRYLHRKITE